MEILLGVGGVVGLFVFGALILKIRDWLVAPRPLSDTEQRAAVAAWDARVLAPDWAAVERRLGQAAPAVLRDLYTDRDLLLSPPITVAAPTGAGGQEYHIATFQPADAEGTESDHFGIPASAFCFATTKFGDPYYVEFRPRREDGPVSVLYHDGGDIVRVANSLREFLAWPRRPDVRHRDPEA
jgi:hypothetical protein